MGRSLDYEKVKRRQDAVARKAERPSRPARLAKAPTEKQLGFLRKLGVEEIPDDSAMASRWIKAALRSRDPLSALRRIGTSHGRPMTSKEKAREVPCPKCGAAAGSPCLRINGDARTNSSHEQRHAAAVLYRETADRQPFVVDLPYVEPSGKPGRWRGGPGAPEGLRDVSQKSRSRKRVKGKRTKNS